MLELTGTERAEEIHSLRQAKSGQELMVSRNAIIRVLERFAAGHITAKEVEDWADSLEAMDGVQYEDGHQDTIAEVLFQLGAPEINAPLDNEGAQKLISKLKQ